MKKIIISITIIILLTALFFIPIKKENTIKVAEVTHSVFYTPFYVALENDYFKEENLNIELLLTPGADKVATSVLSNDVQIGFSGPEATIYVYKNSKERLISFASLTKKDGQFIVGDCTLKNTFTLNDLKGKKVLAGRNGGMPLMMFKYALYKNNINEKEIDIDTSIDFASLSGAYISKQGDFVNLFEPNALNIEKNNYGCVLTSLGNLTENIPYTTFYAKNSYINENKETIKKFNKALNKGITFTKQNNSKTIAKVIHNQFIDTDINDLEILIERYKNIDSWYESTYINKNDFDKLQDILIYGKSLDKKIDISTLITNEFNE